MKKTYLLHQRDLNRITKMLRRLELTVAQAIQLCDSARVKTSANKKARFHFRDEIALTEQQLDLIRWHREHSDSYDSDSADF